MNYQNRSIYPSPLDDFRVRGATSPILVTAFCGLHLSLHSPASRCPLWRGVALLPYSRRPPALAMVAPSLWPLLRSYSSHRCAAIPLLPHPCCSTAEEVPCASATALLLLNHHALPLRCRSSRRRRLCACSFVVAPLILRRRSCSCSFAVARRSRWLCSIGGGGARTTVVARAWECCHEPRQATHGRGSQVALLSHAEPRRAWRRGRDGRDRNLARTLHRKLAH
jgi:hypothetical protein